MCDSQLAHRVVVDQTSIVIDSVLYSLIDLARKIDRRTVGQVTTVCEAHAQYGIAGLEERLKNSDVGTRA